MMLPMPTQRPLSGAPLYDELFDLCRALAEIWFGGSPDSAPCSTGAPKERGAWLLLDSRQSGDVPIRATSLVDLGRTVRDVRRLEHDGPDVTAPIGEID